MTAKAPNLRKLKYNQDSTQWSRFLEESIYLDKGVVNFVPRYQAISFIVKDGLLPQVEERGYVLSTTPQKITEKLLNILFRMWRGHSVDIPNHQYGYAFEHYEMFLHKFESRIMDKFWNAWGDVEDFSEEGYAYKFRFLMPFFLWNMVDLASSAVTHEVEHDLQERKEFEEQVRRGEISKGKDDPYLQDIQQGFNGRDKHSY